MTAPDPGTPFPDAGHEAIRQWVQGALGGVDDAYFLTDLLFDLLNSALTTIDDLTTRIAALEAPGP